MKKIPQNLTLIFSLCLLTSCGPILFKMMGLKKGKELTHDQITKQAVKYGIPEKDSYEMDTSYMTYVLDLDTTF